MHDGMGRWVTLPARSRILTMEPDLGFGDVL